MSRKPCCSGEGLKKGAWTIEEDKKLISYIQQHGEGGWRDIPERAGLKRCGKSCRLRWTNYLKPDIKRGEFSAEEEQIIIMLHASRGNKWSVIARHLPKRTDNEIKNYWNTHLKRRLIEKGIDPETHKPLTSNPTPDYENAPVPDEQPPPPPPLQRPSQSSVGTENSQNKTLRSSSSSSISSLLNKMATRVTSIKGVISASVEGTGGGSISSTSTTTGTSSPNIWEINSAHNQVSMATEEEDDSDPFSQSSSWYGHYQEVDFSKLLEEFGREDDNNNYDDDNGLMMFDHDHVSSSYVDEYMMSQMDGCFDYSID